MAAAPAASKPLIRAAPSPHCQPQIASFPSMSDISEPNSPPWTEREDELRVALQSPDPQKIRALIDSGASIHARDVLGGTALHVAVNFLGDLEVIELLLDRGADVHAQNDDGNTPLLVALRHAHYRHEDPDRLMKVVGRLLSRGASAKVAGSDGALPVRAAMDPVNLPLIQLLLSHGAEMPEDGLDWALSNGHSELVRSLLERPTPAMLKFKDPFGGSMLHRAVENPELLFAAQRLVEHGADLRAADNDGTTPFGRAAQHDNIPALDELHRLGAATTAANLQGQTPLHLAAYGARHDVLGWLLERGADLHAKDSWGRKPLDIAIDTHRFAFYDEDEKLRLVTLLGGTAADVLRGRYTNDPLHEATRQLDLPEVRHLLAAGANPNVKNESGSTPLFWAIAWSSGLPATPKERSFGKELLPVLIRHGADPDMRMGDGSTERTYAEYARGLGLGDLLESTMRRHAPRRG